MVAGSLGGRCLGRQKLCRVDRGEAKPTATRHLASPLPPQVTFSSLDIIHVSVYALIGRE